MVLSASSQVTTTHSQLKKANFALFDLIPFYFTLRLIFTLFQQSNEQSWRRKSVDVEDQVIQVVDFRTFCVENSARSFCVEKQHKEKN